MRTSWELVTRSHTNSEKSRTFIVGAVKHLSGSTPHPTPRGCDLSFINTLKDFRCIIYNSCFRNLNVFLIFFMLLWCRPLKLIRMFLEKKTLPLHHNTELNEHHGVHTSTVAESTTVLFSPCRVHRVQRKQMFCYPHLSSFACVVQKSFMSQVGQLYQ